MIRNVVLHVTNEQPLMADVFDIPTATDAGLLCTNLRMMDGKRPVFIDSIEATFFFPYHVIRFIEMPVGAFEDHELSRGGPGPGRTQARRHDRASDHEVLALPASTGGAADGAEPEGDLELEIDADFLQRIRDI